MCTRFYVEPASYQSLITRAQRIQLANDIMVKLGKPLTMCGEMRPTDAPVVNCRLETADKKEMWKDSWFRRCCVIPCSWYFEWEHFRSPDGKRSKVGDKYLIQPKGADTTLLAGFYRIEERKGLQVPVFSVLTRDATEELRAIHDRMPLILRREDVSAWIRPDGNPREISQRALTEMCLEKTS